MNDKLLVIWWSINLMVVRYWQKKCDLSIHRMPQKWRDGGGIELGSTLCLSALEKNGIIMKKIIIMAPMYEEKGGEGFARRGGKQLRS